MDYRNAWKPSAKRFDEFRLQLDREKPSPGLQSRKDLLGKYARPRPEFDARLNAGPVDPVDDLVSQLSRTRRYGSNYTGAF